MTRAKTDSHMYAFYESQKDVFLEFIKHSDEKTILIQSIIQELAKYPTKTQFIFTDIWAGSWIVASGIIPFLQSKFSEFVYHFIEPSEILASNFKQTELWKNVQFTHNFIESIRLPASDFILASHTLQYVENLKEVLQKIYESLNPWGIFLIVGLSKESHDVILKRELGHTVADTTEITLRFLKEMGIPFSHTSNISHIYDLEDTIKLGGFLKDYITFLCNLPFSEISENHIKHIRLYLWKHTQNWVLEKKENYIFIRKPTKWIILPSFGLLKNQILIRPLQEIQKENILILNDIAIYQKRAIDNNFKQSLYSFIEQRMFRYAVRIRDEYELKTEEEIKNKFYEIVRDIFDFSYTLTQNDVDIHIESLNTLHKKLFPKGLWGQSVWPNGQTMKTLFPSGEFRKNREFRMYDAKQYDYLSPEAIESEMLIANNIPQEKSELHILIRLILQLHHFWFIHPYYNGNGTLFMIVLGIQLTRNGYAIPRDFANDLQKMVDDWLFLKADSGDYEELIKRYLSLFCKPKENMLV